MGEIVVRGLEADARQRLMRRAQLLVRKHIPASRSLVDELLRERRREAKRD